jgi:cytochrome b561
MNLPGANARYSPPARFFHWLTVLCVFSAWGLGLIGDDLPRGPIRHTGEFVHILIGETVVLLLVLRLAWRFITPAPLPEATRFGLAGDMATRGVHLALYGFLLAVPVVGVVTLFHGGEALSLYGLFDIPSPWPKNRELKHNSKEIHELLAHLLIVLALLHAAAALAHHYVFRDGVLKRMLPWSPAGN